MPIKKREEYTRHTPISLRQWKGDETRKIYFTDEGKDVPETKHGLMYLYLVYDISNKSNKELRELWIAPNSPLAIGLSRHVPLINKTFNITKTTGAKQSDTRYEAKEV